MAFPTVIVEAAFGSNATSTNPSWTDITAYTESTVRTSRGRLKELDSIAAGTASLSLDNADRRFDPTNLSGPYVAAGATQVLPLVPVRIRANYSATTYNVWRGFMDGWPQKFQDPKKATIDVSATDALKIFALIKQPSPWSVEVTTDAPTHWWKLNDPAGATVVADSGSAPAPGVVRSGVTLGVATVAPFSGQSCATFALGKIELGTAPQITALPFTLEFWIKVASAPSVTVASIYEQGVTDIHVFHNTDGGVGYLVRGNGVRSTNSITDNLPHHVACVATSTTTQIFVDGVDRSDVVPAHSIPLGGTCLIGSPSAAQNNYLTGTLDDVIIYAGTALSQARITAHCNAGANGYTGDLSGARVNRILDAASWPSADRTINTGSSTLQANLLGATTFDALKAVALAEDARIYIDDDGKVMFVGRANFQSETRFITNQSILGNSGSQIQYEGSPEYEFDDALIYNDVHITRTGGQEQVASDATSQGVYYVRSYALTGLLNNTDSEALGRAQKINSDHKAPLIRVKQVSFDGGSDDTRFPTMLGRKLGDRVTLTVTTPAGSVMSNDFIVEKIGHTITDVSWITDFYMSPAPVSYWILADTTYGVLDTTTRLSY